MANETKLFTRQPNGRLAYFLAGPGRFNAGEMSEDGEGQLAGQGYSEAPPEVFARQRRGYEQDMPGTPADSGLPHSDPTAHPFSTLPAGASRVATRSIDGTTPYFHATGNFMEEGRLPVGADPQQLAEQGYVFADAPAYVEAHDRLDPMHPPQDKPAPADPQADALASLSNPQPAGDSPEDVDALGRAFDADFAPRPKPAPRAVASRPAVSVQSVPSTVALASPLGGSSPPSRAPMNGPAMAQQAQPAPETLADVQARANQQRAQAGLLRAGSRIGAALAGTKPEYDTADDMEKGADRTVADYLQQKAAAEQEKQRAEQDALKDPNSPQSKRLQSYVAATFKGIYTPEQISHMTAADRESIFEAGKMRATLDERAKQAADEAASRERIAKDNRDAREGEWKQRALDRGLQRELAKAKADDAATAKAGALNFSHEDALRKEFEGQQAVKDYRNAQVSFDKVQAAANTPGATGALALVYGVMKTLDPTSAVKESEAATVENARGVPEAIRAKWNALLSGDTLPDSQRRELVEMARRQLGAYKSNYDGLATHYRDLAKSVGVTPERVAMPLGLDLNAPVSSGKVLMTAPTGKRYRVDPSEVDAATKNGWRRADG